MTRGKAAKEVQKLPYRPPALERLGSVAEITAAGNGPFDPADSTCGYGPATAGS